MGEDEPRYELREGPLFLASVHRRIHSVREWDEIRTYLDIALAQDPTDPQFASPIGAMLWAATITEWPDTVLLYEVRQEEYIVIYEALIPTLD